MKDDDRIIFAYTCASRKFLTHIIKFKSQSASFNFYFVIRKFLKLFSCRKILVKMSKADRIVQELMYIENKKGTVWDDRKRDLSYIDHRNALKKIKKKVDNDCPVVSAKKFFPQMKYIAKQWQMEERIRGNILILRELNKIQRSRVIFFDFPLK